MRELTPSGTDACSSAISACERLDESILYRLMVLSKVPMLAAAGDAV